ncbi:MAG TPA: helix-turn-helix domain-containing protein [Acidimicrobiia bacterium]|nr:helix-turn-helix domain-containing protein [Acidimicrobiia bacterium]
MDNNGAHRTEEPGDRERPIPKRSSAVTADRRRVWSVDEAAMILGISRAHAYELVARNDLPYVRLGRRIPIPANVVDELLDVASG